LPRLQSSPPQEKSLHRLQEESPPQTAAGLIYHLLANMPRIVGVNIPDNKRVEIALTYIFGIGRTTSNKILNTIGIDKNTRAKNLGPDEINKIKVEIEKYKTEGELRHEVTSNIKRLKEIGSYRGARHSKHLPVRGQQTKTNSRTVRGNVRRTMGSGKRKVEKK